MPENPTVKTLTADIVNVGPEGSRCTLSGGDIEALGIVTTGLETSVIRLVDTEVLTPTDVSSELVVKVVYDDDSQLHINLQ